ncbi:MAG: permease, partial [Actinomycetota bacterium]
LGPRRILIASNIVSGPLILLFVVVGGIPGAIAVTLLAPFVIGTYGVTMVMSQEYLPSRIGLASGLTIAVVAGLVIGRLNLERYIEDYVWDVRMGASVGETALTFEDRLRDAWLQTRSIVQRVLPFVVVGIGIGAVIHGFVPEELVVAVGGPDNPLAVPALVLLGVPLYLDAAGTLPIVEALVGKGLPLGSALAFMMAVVGLSLPELVILRRVMKPRLIAAFVAVVATGILLVGFGFNVILA